MPSTSVHLPDALVEHLDQLAADRGVSRNRLIITACEEYLLQHQANWPSGFFEDRPMDDDLAALRAAGAEMEEAIYAARHQRPVPPL